ncbi:MAG: multicopper oxidase family protein [Alphaproteobacteria bacterium]
MTGIDRRTLLKTGAAAGMVPLLGGGASAATNRFRLDCAPSDGWLMGEDNGPARLWTYNGVNPGPEIRIRRGNRLTVDVANNLPQGTSVHWHGIRIDNAMDGVSGLTQKAIEPGAEFTYDFVAPDAGTYWYHPHNRTWEQLARGLYGPLIVEEHDPYPVDSEQTLVIDDWRLNEDGSLDEESFGNGMDWSHAGRLGNWATVNSRSTPVYSFALRERVRVRLLNASNARVIPLTFGGLPATLIALDGQPLDFPERLDPATPLVLAPAQRADIVVDMTGPGALSVPGRDGATLITTFRVEGDTVSGLSEAPVSPLPGNDLPQPVLADAQSVLLAMQGGAMRWLDSGVYKGDTLDGRSLAEQGQFWSFNGQVGMSDTPLFTADAGRTMTVEMVNDSRWPHAMHFHGHHFRVVAENGSPAPPGPWRDTLLLNPDERKQIAFVADNPGRWMIHCHMLEHQAAGMVTWFQVV